MSGQRKQTASLESYSVSVLHDTGEICKNENDLPFKKWIKFGRDL